MTDLDQYLTDEMIEQWRKVREEHYLCDPPAICTCGWRSGFYTEADGLPRFEAHLVELALEAALPEIIRRVKAEAWEEGHIAGHEDARAVQPTYPQPTLNPHEQGGQP